MGENFVNVTEGSGKKLHTFNKTIGANDVHDEVVLLGENYLASYIISAGASTATVNSHLLQIMAGASLKVRVRRIEVYQSVAATTATLAGIEIHRLTTAGTGGSAVTPTPLDTSDAASGATGMVLPTVKGTESAAIVALADFTLVQTISASLVAGLCAVWDFDRPRSKPLIIPSGAANGIALKNMVAVAGATVQVNVWIDETNF